MASFLGSQLSLFPPHNYKGQLNIVEGQRAVAHRILAILLIRSGELPLLPDLGLAPELFTPLSDSSVYAFAYESQEVIMRWNQRAKMGIRSLNINPIVDNKKGEVTLQITFSTVTSPTNNVLTFGYWDLMGAIANQDLSGFIDRVLVSGFN
jgi:hypothetical protein